MRRKNVPYFLLLLFGIIFFTQCEKEDFGGLPVDGAGNVYDTVVIGTQPMSGQPRLTTSFFIENENKTRKYYDIYSA